MNSIEAVKQSIMVGLGVSVMPEIAVRTELTLCAASSCSNIIR